MRALRGRAHAARLAMPNGGSRPRDQRIRGRRRTAASSMPSPIGIELYGNPQARAPHGVGHPALLPRLEPEAGGEHRQHDAEGERHQDRGEREPPARARAQVVRQHVDVDVAARQQHVRAADEGGGDQAPGDEIGLPDGVLVQHVAHEHHLADDHHAERDQRRGDDAAELRHAPDGADVSVQSVT